ncbi:hypothetical protein AAY86_27165 [Pseudomonas amygdali pv. tabaci str. ATCC 11528]|nr:MULTISPECIES: hypothetical protein [Pseudomonas syringae group genomosp. 2]KPX61670.1 Uncharacterized protein ALO35_02016 [Pseudomonas amygdali pv. lachrymans]KEZ25970.1 hypothetical protein A3SK_0118490 [Pseudomonas amygdali pv. tabaci str. 6605]KEZ68731.1 hypothetical protein C1E_0210230 [Pseudomonas amygdali pv. tabaci str. ATCC 11528]KIY15458.1 hypothetical protein RD00_24765 [Pseudomonas amygdali pv. tabaci]KKY49575.1 hypothetical protein AAY86_27165 [Pseudomonas amygdali pv. tabaci st
MSLDENFVRAIYEELFEENFNRYKEILSQPIDDGKDSFARARNALALLDDTERSQVINFFKVVMFDSASVILGTLDGVHFPDDLDGDFLLLCDGKEIQGSLADIFIGKAQDAGVYE